MAPRVSLSRDATARLATGGEVALPRWTVLAADGGEELPIEQRPLWVATAQGLVAAQVPGDALVATERPLTRRAVLEEAFGYLGQPYGWGDEAGGRDCSRFLLDLFDSFGLSLPRHSSYQAQAGTFSIDVSALANEEERLLIIDAAAHRGIVLLHFPGHIMLYLGRDSEGVPRVMHAFAEYLVPCEGVPPADDGTIAETLMTVDRISVSDLQLGRGSSRTAFIQRLTRITVLGNTPGPELAGGATLRPAAPLQIPSEDACDSRSLTAVYVSPRTPSTEEGLRVIITGDEDPGPVELVLISPSGEEVRPSVRRLGGPPFSFVARVDSPERGTWMAALGDGSRLVVCREIRVAARPSRADGDPLGPVWES
jgi:hypothetical protein